MSNTQSTPRSLPSRRRLIAWALTAVPSFGSNAQVQFVFGTYGTKSLSPQKALATIAAAGYDGVELCLLPGYQTNAATFSPEAVRDYRQLLLRHQLSVPAVLDNMPLFGAKEKTQATVERLRRIAEIAHGLSPDVPLVLDTVLGGKPEDWNEQRYRVIDDLRSWARIAEQSAFTIAVKPHADQALNSPARALELLRAVDSKRIRLESPALVRPVHCPSESLRQLDR